MSFNSFNNLATRPLHENANRMIDRIIAARRDLAGDTFVVPRSGNTSLTVMTVNEVFKSPVYNAERMAFGQELSVLRHLQGQQLVVNIPTLTWTAEDGQTYGMSRLHGEALLARSVLAMDDAEQTKIATALGNFNAALSRSITPEQRKDMQLPAAAGTPQIMPRHLFEALEPSYVKAYLGEANFATAQRLAEYYDRTFDADEQERRLLFLHPDLHEHNVLYDRNTGDIGVIDIGTGKMVPLELAFCVMREFYPDSFVAKTLEAFCDASGFKVAHEEIEVYYAARALRLSVSDTEALNHFRHNVERLKSALDVLEGVTERKPPPNQLPPPPPIQNMR